MGIRRDPWHGLLADAFNAVAEASRRQLLDALGPGEVTVRELFGQLDLTQHQLSKTLGVLPAVDLVSARTAGRHRHVPPRIRYRHAPVGPRCPAVRTATLGLRPDDSNWHYSVLTYWARRR